MADTQKTHKWIVYVRGVKNEDISPIVDKVVFLLHHSFDQPQRTVSKPPFELHEEGWGQFVIGVHIYLRSVAVPTRTSKFLYFTPMLRSSHCVPPTGEPYVKGIENQIPPFTNQPLPVVTEEYDELVVVRPPDALFLAVKAHCSQPQSPHPTRGVSCWQHIQSTAKKSRADALVPPSDEGDTKALAKLFDDVVEARDAARAQYESMQANKILHAVK